MSAGGTRLAAGLVTVSVVLIAASGAAFADARLSGIEAPVSGIATLLVPVAAFSVVGGLIVIRRPQNTIGWILLVIGLLWSVVAASTALSSWALTATTLPRAVGEWIAVPSNVWVIALGLLGTQLPLRLPDGKLPSPRWRWYSRVSSGAIALACIGMAVQPGRVNDLAGTTNPLASARLQPLSGVIFLVICSFVGAIGALVVRYRAADAHSRAQLRWMALGGAGFVVVYVVTLPLAGILGLQEGSAAAEAITDVATAAFAALPIRDRLRDPQTPPVRPRRRDQTHPGLRCADRDASGGVPGERVAAPTPAQTFLGSRRRRLDACRRGTLPSSAVAHPSASRPTLSPVQVRRTANDRRVFRAAARRGRPRRADGRVARRIGRHPAAGTRVALAA